MADMYIRICDREDDTTYPCKSFNERKECLVIKRPGEHVMVLQRKDLISPTKIYLMNANGKTIDSRVYRSEEAEVELALEMKDAGMISDLEPGEKVD